MKLTVNDIFCNKCRFILYINKIASSSECTASSEMFLNMEKCGETSPTTGMPEETHINSENVVVAVILYMSTIRVMIILKSYLKVLHLFTGIVLYVKNQLILRQCV